MTDTLPDRVEDIEGSLAELHLQIRGRPELHIDGFAIRLTRIEIKLDEAVDAETRIKQIQDRHDEQLQSIVNRQFALTVYTITAVAASIISILVHWVI